jgi:hypothetical protein
MPPVPPTAVGALRCSVNVNPSAFGFVSWKTKSLVNDCTLTGGTKNALRPCPAPPSVIRSRVPLIAAPRFSDSPLAVKPLRKSIRAGTPASSAVPSRPIVWT